MATSAQGASSSSPDIARSSSTRGSALQAAESALVVISHLQGSWAANSALHILGHQEPRQRGRS
eukprot:8319416-Pyramimonas_sp.AAC.1